MNSIFNKKTKDESTTYDTMSSLSHTKWNCKYHIVFTPKYRNYRGGSLPRSCSYVCRNTTEVISVKIYGNIKGQK